MLFRRLIKYHSFSYIIAACQLSLMKFQLFFRFKVELQKFLSSFAFELHLAALIKFELRPLFAMLLIIIIISDACLRFLNQILMWLNAIDRPDTQHCYSCPLWYVYHCVSNSSENRISVEWHCCPIDLCVLHDYFDTFNVELLSSISRRAFFYIFILEELFFPSKTKHEILTRPSSNFKFNFT